MVKLCEQPYRQMYVWYTFLKKCFVTNSVVYLIDDTN